MHDASIRERETMMYAILDLKAYYDRQLPNLGRIVQEAVEIKRDSLKLFQ